MGVVEVKKCGRNDGDEATLHGYTATRLHGVQNVETPSEVTSLEELVVERAAQNTQNQTSKQRPLNAELCLLGCYAVWLL
jgi:hypothetical protein